MADERLVLPRRSLIVLCGPAGAGKSTFAGEFARRNRLATTAVVSSDACRLLICDETSSLTQEQWATLQPNTFQLFLTIVGMRMGIGRPAVADGVNLHADLRPRLLDLARTHQYWSLLVAFATPVETCLLRNATREQGRRIPEWQVRAQSQRLDEDLPNLAAEGWDQVIVLDRKRPTALIDLEG
jgi:protein phosphatase